MRVTGRARMIAGINRLTGRDDCRKAVMLTRFRWGLAAYGLVIGLTTALVGAVLSAPRPQGSSISNGTR